VTATANVTANVTVIAIAIGRVSGVTVAETDRVHATAPALDRVHVNAMAAAAAVVAETEAAGGGHALDPAGETATAVTGEAGDANAPVRGRETPAGAVATIGTAAEGAGGGMTAGTTGTATGTAATEAAAERAAAAATTAISPTTALTAASFTWWGCTI
jgi:hypothetical protein